MAKKRGWKNEPYRHSLASRGIKSGQRFTLGSRTSEAIMKYGTDENKRLITVTERLYNRLKKMFPEEYIWLSPTYVDVKSKTAGFVIGASMAGPVDFNELYEKYEKKAEKRFLKEKKLKNLNRDKDYQEFSEHFMFDSPEIKEYEKETAKLFEKHVTQPVKERVKKMEKMSGFISQKITRIGERKEWRIVFSLEGKK